MREKEANAIFIRYVREVAAGRRKFGNVTLELSHILPFATGTAEEPILGFERCPLLHFIAPHENTVTLPSVPVCTVCDAEFEGDEKSSENSDQQLPLASQVKVVPTFWLESRTYINNIELPVASSVHPLPPVENLYNVYDHAFSESYFEVL